MWITDLLSRGWPLVVTLCLGLGSTIRCQETTDDNGVDPTRDCGAYCLGIAFELLEGPELSFTQLRSEAGIDEHGLTNLQALNAAASRAGLDTLAIERPVRRPDSVMIAPLKVNIARQDAYHFVVLRPTVAGKVVVYSPPTWVYETSWDQLRPRLGPSLLCLRNGSSKDDDSLEILGFALLGCAAAAGLIWFLGHRRGMQAMSMLLAAPLLLVGCGGESHAAGGIVIEPSSFLNIGIVPAGNKRVEFQIANRSGKAARLVRASTSCSCAVVSPQPPVDLAPGEILDAVVNINVSPNETRTVVLVYAFDDHPPVPIQISLSGVLSGVRYEQDHYLPQGSPGETIPFRLSMTVQPDTVPLLFGDSEDASDKEGSWNVVEVGPATLTRQGRAEVAERPGWVELWAEGEVTSEIAVAGNTKIVCSIDKLHVPFNVLWSFAPPATVSPSILVLSNSSGLYRGSFAVKPNDGFRVASVESPDDSVTCAIEKAEDNWKVDVSAPSSWGSDAGHTRVTVNLENDHGQRRSFPFTICAP